MARGRIISFDAADALGEIELEDGRVVRFGLSAMQNLRPDLGTAVDVHGVVLGFGGRWRATAVRKSDTNQPAENSVEKLFGAPDMPAFELVFPTRELAASDIQGLARDEEDRRNLIPARIRSRPQFGEIERMFSVKLPNKLREAWSRFCESDEDASMDIIFIPIEDIADLESTARFVCDEHVSLDELQILPGKPFPVLPFAESQQSSDYFVLDLSRPTSSGDFPVLYIPHDAIDGILEVAPTSADWLDDPCDPGSIENEGFGAR